MKIRVTKKDIKEGDRNNPFNCPISLAVGRKIGLDKLSPFLQRYTRIGVCNATIDIGYKIFKTPAICKKFIKDFDKGCEVAPFEIDI